MIKASVGELLAHGGSLYLIRLSGLEDFFRELIILDI
jgi:hypothetical protein